MELPCVTEQDVHSVWVSAFANTNTIQGEASLINIDNASKLIECEYQLTGIEELLSGQNIFKRQLNSTNTILLRLFFRETEFQQELFPLRKHVLQVQSRRRASA